MVPTIQLGISVLKGQLIEAEAYIRAGMSEFFYSVCLIFQTFTYKHRSLCWYSNEWFNIACICPQAMYCSTLWTDRPRRGYWECPVLGNLDCAVHILQQGFHLWRRSKYKAYDLPYPPLNQYEQCWSSFSEPSVNVKRDLPRIEKSMGEIAQSHGTPTRPGARMIQTVGNTKREIQPSYELSKRGAFVPTCPGFLSCPNINNQIGQDNTDNDIYSDCEFSRVVSLLLYN